MSETIPILCGSVAGKAGSLGVKLHDAGYAALGLNFKYVAIASDTLDPVIDAIKVLGFKGLGVSMPFKQQVIRFLDEVQPEVQTIGACNTVVLNGNTLTGFNTDWQGAIAALKECSGDLGESATIVGAGGVARAIAYGLKKNGLRVYVAARSVIRRSTLVDQLRLDGECGLNEQGKFGSSLVVNATPSADFPGGPVDLDQHTKGRILLDVVFQQKKTPLAAQATSRSWLVAPGWRMLLHQALRQFELYTGQAAPVQAMEKVLYEALS